MDKKVSISASAYYVPDPVEIYVFVDEEPSDLPDNALLIQRVDTITDQKGIDAFIETLQPYFLLGAR